MSITELGNRLGISRSYMSRIENGQRSIKSDVLVKIADILDAPIEDFYPDENKRKMHLDSGEILIIQKDLYNLNKYTDDEILEFIRLGKDKFEKNDE